MVMAPASTAENCAQRIGFHIPKTANHIDEDIIQADIQRKTDEAYKNKTSNFFLGIFFESAENVQCLFSR